MPYGRRDQRQGRSGQTREIVLWARRRISSDCLRISARQLWRQVLRQEHGRYSAKVLTPSRGVLHLPSGNCCRNDRAERDARRRRRKISSATEWIGLWQGANRDSSAWTHQTERR